MGWCDCQWEDKNGVLTCIVCGHVPSPTEWDEKDPFGSLNRIAYACNRKRRVKLVDTEEQ